jgi:hypothetical protein
MGRGSAAAGGAEVQTGKHLGRTIASPGALIALVIAAGGAGVAATVALGPALGAAAAGAVALLWFLIVAVVSMGRAKDAFYAAYAEQRGLRWNGSGGISAATPLLRRGDTRRADASFTGELPGGLEGVLALYTYEERGAAGQGNQTQELHHFTVVLADLPGLESRLPALYCQRRSGFRFLDGAEDVLRSTERVELESERLDKLSEIFADPRCDANWLRQLFSPSFVVYLAEEAPKGFAFEVENGTLCVNVNRHRGSAEELDEISNAAAAVAKRIREEAAE